MNCSLPGSSVHGILQARILEWVAISCCRGSSPLRDLTGIPVSPARQMDSLLLSHQGSLQQVLLLTPECEMWSPLITVLPDSAFQGAEIHSGSWDTFRFPKSFSSACRSPAERDQSRALEAKARDRPPPGSLQAVGQEAQEEEGNGGGEGERGCGTIFLLSFSGSQTSWPQDHLILWKWGFQRAFGHVGFIYEDWALLEIKTDIYRIRKCLKITIVGLLWWSSVYKSACQCRGHRFNPWSRKISPTSGQLRPCTTLSPCA